MKKVLLAILFVIVLIVIGGFFYWKQLTIEEQWLFFNKRIASEYAKALLAAKPTQKTPDELIDMLITAENGVVTFAPHENEGSFVIAYSPSRVPNPIQATKPKMIMLWRKLQKDWYALSINQ